MVAGVVVDIVVVRSGGSGNEDEGFEGGTSGLSSEGPAMGTDDDGTEANNSPSTSSSDESFSKNPFGCLWQMRSA